ncbi:MAG TPA: NIPSNAP family protein [Alphaproteobacteria bacterium]|nr:NIPSNAP family protein [Alphaproteobacteria bacterium]
MLHELRIYTFRAGQAPLAAKNSGTVARDIRGDDYGKLEGYWLPEIGPLNQVMHLWSYDSYADREEKRKALSQNERWTGEYLPLIRPILLRQDIRLMNPIIGPKAPEGEGNIYEFRYYRLQPGALKRWVDLFTNALTVREKYSKIVGLWTTEAGQPNEVCHIWGYKDFATRMEARGAAAQDPGWQAFLKEGGPLIDEMNSVLMLPSAHSPLK